jgi:hypothetical protein
VFGASSRQQEQKPFRERFDLNFRFAPKGGHLTSMAAEPKADCQLLRTHAGKSIAIWKMKCKHEKISIG